MSFPFLKLLNSILETWGCSFDVIESYLPLCIFLKIVFFSITSQTLFKYLHWLFSYNYNFTHWLDCWVTFNDKNRCQFILPSMLSKINITFVSINRKFWRWLLFCFVICTQPEELQRKPVIKIMHIESQFLGMVIMYC